MTPAGSMRSAEQVHWGELPLGCLQFYPSRKSTEERSKVEAKYRAERIDICPFEPHRLPTSISSRLKYF